MAIPSTPTWATTISSAMISAGRLNVSLLEVSNMSARGAQDIKTELWAASTYDAFLTTETVVLVTTGNSVVTLPPDFDHEVSLRIYDGSVRGRASTGQSRQITLDTNADSGDNSYVGLFAFTLAGTGSGQREQISNYTGSTRIATVTQAWTAPDNTTDYMIGQTWWPMKRSDTTAYYVPNGPPAKYRITGNQLTVWPPPDKVYPIVIEYGPNLTMIDETSDIFTKWLKQRVALVKQGIKVQTMLLFDDDRYDQQMAIWEQMKQKYGAQNCIYDVSDGSR